MEHYFLTSIKVVNGEIYGALVKGSSCIVFRLSGDSIEELTHIPGGPCVILWGSSEGLIVSSGNSLYLVSDGGSRLLFKALMPCNWFWHACEGGGRLFIQEYGKPTTGIYVSEDVKNFNRVVSNIDLDPWSKHFHYVAFDERRNALVATLGDGNLTRVALSLDYGNSWKTMYRGPWQFVPILIEKDKWLFGFDSSIAKGGVAIYYPDSGKWKFVFLKLKSCPYAQFVELKKFRDLYIAALGYPSAVIVSNSIDSWHVLYSNIGNRYDFYTTLDILGNNIYASVGGKLLTFDNDRIRQSLTEVPDLVRYRGYVDRLKGTFFTLKRLKFHIYA